MTDILIRKIYKTLDTYSQDIRPLLSGIMNHVHGLEHLEETTLTGLLEQASSHIMLFQQNFEVNYNTLLKFAPSPLDNKLTVLSTLYEYYLNFVGLAFILALNWTQDFDKDDYPALRPLIYPLLDEDKFLYCDAQLKQFPRSPGKSLLLDGWLMVLWPSLNPALRHAETLRASLGCMLSTNIHGPIL